MTIAQRLMGRPSPDWCRSSYPAQQFVSIHQNANAYEKRIMAKHCVLKIVQSGECRQKNEAIRYSIFLTGGTHRLFYHRKFKVQLWTWRTSFELAVKNYHLRDETLSEKSKTHHFGATCTGTSTRIVAHAVAYSFGTSSKYSFCTGISLPVSLLFIHGCPFVNGLSHEWLSFDRIGFSGKPPHKESTRLTMPSAAPWDEPWRRCFCSSL